jgi:predicted nuclease of predicted toxin-antitoxin system
MRFLLDQDVPEIIARVIEGAGHQVSRLREKLPVESTDEEVLAFAHAEESLLVTCNRDDFVSLAKAKLHNGIIILIRRTSRVAECGHFLRLYNPPERRDCGTTLTSRKI